MESYEKCSRAFHLPGIRDGSDFRTKSVALFRFRFRLPLNFSVENVYRIGLRDELSGSTNTAIHT